MRILLVCPYDLARPGGVQRHVLDLANALTTDGHVVAVLAPGGIARDDAPFQTVVLGRFRVLQVLGTAFEVSWADQRRVLEALSRFRPEIVHFHTLWTPFLSWQVWSLLRRFPKVARIATFHDTPPQGWTGRAIRRVFQVASWQLSRSLQAAIAVSTAPANHLAIRSGCPLHILPGCIGLGPYRALSVRREGQLRVLFTGRLEPRKGVLVLIQAWSEVSRALPDAQLVICGDGPQAEEARSLVERLALGNTVQLLGAVDEAEKLRQLGTATVFCAPSLYGESYGLVLVEAMAAGVPVVAAANDGYRQVLHGPGSLGLVEPGDVPGLANALITVLEDLPLRQRLSAWGLEASRSADLEAQLPAFLKIYAEAGRSKLDGSGQ